MMRFLAWLAALTLTTPALADCHAESDPDRVSLLELYTSEGCSSCPPAEHWLSNLASAGYGADRVVPLAFHVDYWDYIGWKDRFAAAAYSERQRAIAARQRTGFVYTPQLVFNGQELRDWRQNSSFSRLVATSQHQPAHAKLSLDVTSGTHGMVLRAGAQALAVPDGRQAEVYVAIYENNLESAVDAGENGGRRLHHDYVVRAWYGPYRLDARSAWQQNIMLDPEWKERDAGAVIFAQDRNSGDVLQTLNLKLCG